MLGVKIFILLVFFLWLLPSWRFRSPKSFSLIIVDCTFNTVDGGLHMALGLIAYPIVIPLLLLADIPRFIWRPIEAKYSKLRRASKNRISYLLSFLVFGFIFFSAVQREGRFIEPIENNNGPNEFLYDNSSNT